MGRSVRFRRLWFALLMVATITIAGIAPVLAAPPANEHFERTWARTDKPVADGQVSRTWMWGPEAFTGAIDEDYTEAPGGKRTVQYFDKSRMEITDPAEPDTDSPWYKYHVTNGLLAMELISGQMQVGHNDFVNRGPAAVNVAGDSDDPTGPTYATFTSLATPNHTATSRVGQTVTERVARNSAVTDDPSLAGRGITIAFFDDVTSHNVAQPFWAFMNASGVVWDWRNSVFVTAMLNDDPAFPQGDPYYAVGRPVTEPYWANVKVANTYRDVLMQCFERRCLTYTADNPEGWQVEAGNIGQHYYTWRYEQASEPQPEPPVDGVPALGELLYFRDFTTLVEHQDTQGYGYSSEEGAHLVVHAPPEGWNYYYRLLFSPLDMSEPHHFGDVSLSMDVRLASQGVPSEGCIYVRGTWTSETSYKLYEFCIDQLGDVWAYQEEIGGDAFEYLVEAPEVTGLNPAHEWNRLQVITKGEQYWFLINGVLVHSGQFLPGDTEGQIGSISWNIDEGGDKDSEWIFRNMEVHALR